MGIQQWLQNSTRRPETKQNLRLIDQKYEQKHAIRAKRGKILTDAKCAETLKLVSSAGKHEIGVKRDKMEPVRRAGK